MKSKKNLVRFTGTAIFLALVVVMQLTFGNITIGTVNLNFVLIPIVVGGILFGCASGAVLGLAFGLVVFFQCMTGAQGAFGLALFEISPFGTFLTCFVRGVAMGAIAPLLNRVIVKHFHNPYVGALCSSIALPVINTGLFLLFYALLFNGHLHEMMGATGATAIYFLFVSLAGVNFLLEVATTAIIAPPVAVALKKVQERLDNQK